MKVKIYVDWEHKKIINEKEFKEKIVEATNSYKTDTFYFSGWLTDNYDSFKIWGMSAEEQAKLFEEYAEVCQEWAKEEVNEYWEEKEIEV